MKQPNYSNVSFSIFYKNKIFNFGWKGLKYIFYLLPPSRLTFFRKAIKKLEHPILHDNFFGFFEWSKFSGVHVYIFFRCIFFSFFAVQYVALIQDTFCSFRHFLPCNNRSKLKLSHHIPSTIRCLVLKCHWLNYFIFVLICENTSQVECPNSGRSQYDCFLRFFLALFVFNTIQYTMRKMRKKIYNTYHKQISVQFFQTDLLLPPVKQGRSPA